MTFVIELDNYQGPFDVLLDLLKKRRLDITELAIGSITNDYLDYISNTQLQLDDLSYFLSVATKLALDKSSAVLFIEPAEDEEGIEQSLKKYMEIKALAEKLKSRLASPMLSSNKKYFIKVPVKNIEAEILRDYYAELLNKYNAKPVTKVLKTQKQQIDKMRQGFIENLIKIKKFNTNEVVNSASKTEAIVRLLTILDLLKQGKLSYENNSYSMVGAPV